MSRRSCAKIKTSRLVTGVGEVRHFPRHLHTWAFSDFLMWVMKLKLHDLSLATRSQGPHGHRSSQLQFPLWVVTVAGAHLTGGDALRNFGPARCAVPTIPGRCGQPEAGTSGLLASGSMAWDGAHGEWNLSENWPQRTGRRHPDSLSLQQLLMQNGMCYIVSLGSRKYRSWRRQRLLALPGGLRSWEWSFAWALLMLLSKEV